MIINHEETSTCIVKDDNIFLIIIYPRWMHNDLQVALVGSKVDLTYTYEVRYPCVVLCLVTLDSFSCMYVLWFIIL